MIQDLSADDDPNFLLIIFVIHFVSRQQILIQQKSNTEVLIAIFD